VLDLLVYVRAPRAVSLRNVGEDVCHVLRSEGLECEISEYFYLEDMAKRGVTHVINVSTVDPVWGLYAASTLSFLRVYRGVRTVWYGTVEGYFRRALYSDALFIGHNYVANSTFTKSVLEKFGLKVLGVVPHGVSEEKVRQAIKLGDRIRAELTKALEGKVMFSVVASSRRRKGWEELLEAWSMVDREVRRGSVVLYVSLREVEEAIARAGLSGEFIRYAYMGSLPHDRVLAFIRSTDFMIFPSLAEGFGIPPLEAAALGIPSIHAWFEPLSEFMPRTRLTFDTTGIEEYIEVGEQASGQVYVLHKYEPGELAGKIEEAYYLKVNDPDEYRELSESLARHATQYYASKVYRWFVDWVKKTV
jgi:Glycosyltransferase